MTDEAAFFSRSANANGMALPQYKSIQSNGFKAEDMKPGCSFFKVCNQDLQHLFNQSLQFVFTAFTEAFFYI